MSSSNTAVKQDHNKAPMALIPYAALHSEALVLHHGAEKYGRDNWRKGMNHMRLLNAAMRHLTAYIAGSDDDSESGLSHLAHARACLAFLIHYKTYDLGVDDRPTNSEYKE